MTQASVVTSALPYVLLVLGLLVLALRDSVWRSIQVKAAEESEPSKERPTSRRDMWILAVLFVAGFAVVFFGRDGPTKTLRLGVFLVLAVIFLVVERGRRRAPGSDG